MDTAHVMDIICKLSPIKGELGRRSLALRSIHPLMHYPRFPCSIVVRVLSPLLTLPHPRWSVLLTAFRVSCTGAAGAAGAAGMGTARQKLSTRAGADAQEKTSREQASAGADEQR